ncbi:unnamed protein product, partial [Phaeothamnion confervicola]
HRFSPLLPFAQAEKVTFKVGMTCEGCGNACKRILGRLDGVSEVTVDVDTKMVVVTSDGVTPPQTMLEALMKWSAASGKTVELVQ